jgi:signal transduction histidine kinase
MLFPLLVWAALRFGQRGSTLAVVAVAGLTVWNTTHYEGPFVFESITSSVLATQLFIAVATISTLCLAAVVSEREQLTEEVVASRVRLVETSDRERRRLERNLHDGAQQRLIALTARLHHAGAHQTSEPISRLLVDAEEQLKLATQELRELANGLHPAVLTELGLAYAIRSIAEGATIPMTIHGLPLDRLDETTEATAYYVVAEAVANAQKHARANHIWIRMLQFETIPVLHVAVTDDGVGGATEAASGGLRGLRERVQATGGSFKLNSRPHHGTSIIAEIRQPSPTS